MKVLIYTTRFCPYCIRAKYLLDNKNVSYKEVSVDAKPALRQEMMQKANSHTVPQIWIGDTHVGGCDELFMLERAGTLDSLLQP